MYVHKHGPANTNLAGIVSSVFLYYYHNYYTIIVLEIQGILVYILYWPDGKDVRGNTSAALEADSNTNQAALPVGMS